MSRAAPAPASAVESSATLDIISSFSVDSGVLEVWLLSETELSDGESSPGFLSTLALLAPEGGGGGAGGARPAPLPSTLPPPSALREVIVIDLDHLSHLPPAE